ncbi:unnamed protein product, partial [Heterosigma akashiwo]
RDPRRPWLAREQQSFIELLERCGVVHRRKRYFFDSEPNLNHHFQVLLQYEVDPWIKLPDDV